MTATCSAWDAPPSCLLSCRCTTQLGDHSQTGLKALQHKYRVAAHALLAADSGLADQVTSVRDKQLFAQHCMDAPHAVWYPPCQAFAAATTFHVS